GTMGLEPAAGEAFMRLAQRGGDGPQGAQGRSAVFLLDPSLSISSEETSIRLPAESLSGAVEVGDPFFGIGAIRYPILSRAIIKVGDPAVFLFSVEQIEEGMVTARIVSYRNIKGTPGTGIASITRTSGTGAAGTTDTYTITLTDRSSYDFQVTNGADGSSFVVSGRYETLEDLTAAHPAGVEGEAWAVGSAEDNEIYLWNVDSQSWQAIGSLQGPPGPQGAQGRSAAFLTRVLQVESLEDPISAAPEQLTENVAPGDRFFAVGKLGSVLGGGSLFAPINTFCGQYTVESKDPLTGEISAVLDPQTHAVISGPAGRDGPTGPAGEDGKTPYIGTNGNWWIGTTDTGVSASGIAGECVTSFNGRTGEVVPATGDYTVDQVTGAAPKASPVFTGSISLGRLGNAGTGTIAAGEECVALMAYTQAFGKKCQANGLYAHAHGLECVASGEASTAIGSGTKATGYASTAVGTSCTAKGQHSFAGGRSSNAEGDWCLAFGNACLAANSACAFGDTCQATGQNSFAFGYHTLAVGTYQLALGQYNVGTPDGISMILAGIGRTNTTRANCFRVTTGGVYAKGSYNASGADYAELFQWADGNPAGEDRAGRFVTLDGERIRLAGPEDAFLLGIVSGAPSVVGDVYDDQWQGMFLTDIFGRPVMEDAELPEETIEGPDPEDPSKTVTRVIRPARTERRQKLNPAYDHTQTFRPRTQRPEWDAVGLLGKLVAVDDGTCEVNGWCAVGSDGIATASAVRTRYRVMARLDANHVRVLIL
ncbi:MAG: hypothetical protein K2P20_04555, partial [Oscillospiraceae bacterium]|nr:hypothetical protein [Oscillospiraceae bacterium]